MVLFWLGLAAWVGLAWILKVPIEPDEGQHLIGGRYMLLDWSYTVRILRFVGGYPDWTAEARSFYTFPPVWDGFLAVAIGIFGVGSLAHGFWLVAAMALTIQSVRSIARTVFDSDTALFAITLLVWSRAAFRDGQLLEAEPQVAAFGMGALACVVAGTRSDRLRWFVLAGVCLGVALLMKLWLALPAALLVAGSLCYSLWVGGSVGKTALRLLLLTITAVAVGLLHLGWVMAIAPDDVGTWVYVYLKPVVERFGDETDPLTKPIWFYGAVLYRDFVFVAGLLVAYGLALWSRRPWTLFARILGVSAAVAIVAMSLFGKKESLYIYPLVPVWCLCAAVGARWACEAWARGAPQRRLLRWSAGALGVLLIVFGLALAGLWFFGLRLSTTLNLPFVVGHFAICGLLGIGLAAWAWQGRWPTSTAVAGFVAAHVIWGAVMAGQRIVDYRDNTSQALARYFHAPMAATPPGHETMDPHYVSAASGVHGYWLWKKGRPWYYDDERDLSWAELQATLGDQLLFYEIDRSFKGTLGGPPTAERYQEILVWLLEHTQEITGKIEAAEGRSLSTRIFVPKSLEPSSNGDG